MKIKHSRIWVLKDIFSINEGNLTITNIPNSEELNTFSLKSEKKNPYVLLSSSLFILVLDVLFIAIRHKKC